jgi:hypothetical protein
MDMLIDSANDAAQVGLTPEERELHVKRVELALLESDLAERELGLATLNGEVRAFEARYLSIVGVKFAARDELEALIAEARAGQSLADGFMHQRAADARRKATESAATAGAASVPIPNGAFKPSEHVKGLYRDIAKRVHPDLSTDQKRRDRRTQFMAEVNLAYARGDEARLRSLLEEWDSSPDSVEGESIAADLVRSVRSIHQVKGRLAQIEAETVALKSSDLYRLRSEVETANAHGRDLLADMARQLDAEISELRALLQSLVSVEVSHD